MLKYLVFVLISFANIIALNGSNMHSNDRVCQPMRWYSIGPCQFCYCLNERTLKCNRGTKTLTNLPMASKRVYLCDADFRLDITQLQSDEVHVMRHRMTRGNSGSSEEEGGYSINKKKNIYTRSGDYCQDDDGTKVDDSFCDNLKEEKKKKPKVTVEPDQTLNTTSNENRFNVQVQHHKEIKEGFNVDFNLPKTIMKLIKMGMRKSMLTIKPGNDCESGTQYLEDTLCFCMNNGKLLCRNGSATPKAHS